MPKFPVIFRSSKGMAFFVTLAVLVSLLAVAATFHARSHFAFKSFVTFKDTSVLRQMAASGVNLGMAVLILDKNANTEDSFLDAWADQESLWNMSQLLVFKDGRCAVTITDLGGKIPINALAEQRYNDNHEALAVVLERLIADNLMDLIVDANMTPSRIVANIKQYIENNPHAEYNYINDPRELLQIDGITALLLFGERNLDRDFNSVDYWRGNTGVVYDDSYGHLAGLIQFINVFGFVGDQQDALYFDGKINLNTAPREVVFALFPERDAPLVNNIYRKMRATLAGTASEDVEFHKVDWFKDETELLGHPGYSYNEKLITTQSDWFEICAVGADYNGMEKRIKATVKRERSITGRLECKVYAWEESDTVPVSKNLAELFRQSGGYKPARTMPFSELKQH